MISVELQKAGGGSERCISSNISRAGVCVDGHAVCQDSTDPVKVAFICRHTELGCHELPSLVVFCQDKKEHVAALPTDYERIRLWKSVHLSFRKLKGARESPP